MAAINPQRPEALVETSSSVLMADAARVAFETHLMNSLSTGINVCLGATNARTKKRHGKLRICMGGIFERPFVAVLGRSRVLCRNETFNLRWPRCLN